MENTEPDGGSNTDWEIYWIGTTSVGASGDCCVLVWGDLQSDDPEEQYVVVIDAGRNKADLEKLITTLTVEIGTNRINLLVGTHSDRDHIGKFPALLADERVTVDQIWMRNPYKHLDVYEDYEEQQPLVVTASASDVSDIVHNHHDVEIHEPKPGEIFAGALTVLGPSDDFYRELLPKIFTLDELLEQRAKYGSAVIAMAAARPLEGSSGRYTPPSYAKAPKRSASWTEDNLSAGRNDATNDVSIIMMFETPAGELILFTGDAGVRSFDRASDDMERLGFDPERLKYMQLPHHASYHNISTELLDQILGPIVGDHTSAEALAKASKRRCYAMSGSGDTYHPSQRVTNAAHRRGWTPYVTKGSTIRTHSGFKRPDTEYTNTRKPFGFVDDPES